MAICSNTGFDLVCLVIDYDLSLQHDAWTSFCNLQPNGHLPYSSHVFKLTQVGTSITQFSCTVIFITLFCTVNEEGILAKFVLEII